jgi:hypothetical protein
LNRRQPAVVAPPSSGDPFSPGLLEFFVEQIFHVGRVFHVVYVPADHVLAHDVV